MFHNKAVKQQLEQASQMKAQAEEYLRVLDAVDSDAGEALIEVDQLQMSAERMDRSLTKVVDYAKDTKEQQEYISNQMEEMKQEMSDVTASVEELQQLYDSKCDFLQRQQEALTDLQELGKRYTSLSKAVSDISTKEDARVAKLLQDNEKLSAFSGVVSTLALQSAIDAGRLGDEGMGYIKTAEQIRSLANDFTAQTKEMADAIAEMKEQNQEMMDKIHTFISLLKENTVSLGKIAAETAKENEKPTFDKEFLETKVGGMGIHIDSALDQVQHSKDKQSQLMDEMENIGACYMTQQDSTARMEELITNTKRMLSNINQDQEVNETTPSDS